MATETSPRTVRFSNAEEDPRPDKSKTPRPSSVILERPSDHVDEYIDPPHRPLGSQEDLTSLARYAESAGVPTPKATLAPPVNGGLRSTRSSASDGDGQLYTNGSGTPRPARPTGPARTPSSTYAPVRRPLQGNPSFSEHPRSSSKTRRGDRFRDRAYLQRIRQDFNSEYFNSYSNSSSTTTHGDSDSEGETPSSEGPFDERNEEIIMFYGNDDMQPTEEDVKDPASRERLEWHGMLEAVLTGDVVKQEKKRLINSTDRTDGKALHQSEELWLGIRSRVCGRHLPVQRRMVEDARSALDRILDDVVNFQIKGESEAGKPPHEQVKSIVAEIEKCDNYYPSWSVLVRNHKTAESPGFVEAYGAIMAWHNTNELINTELSILKKWVGNEDLDFTRAKERLPSTSSLNDEPSFLDRLMKEDGLRTLYSEEDDTERHGVDDSRRGLEVMDQRMAGDLDPHPLPELERVGMHYMRRGTDGKNKRDKGMFVRISSVIRKSKRTLIENYPAFQKRHLPPYIEELLTLISFPSRLVEEIIRMISQFQLILKLAIRIKQEYVAISQPEPGWDLPPCIDESFDQVVLEALKYYFKMLNWKLSGNKNTFKEAELLFQEWDFGNHVGGHLQNGDIEVAEQFSSLTYKAFNRLSQTFEKELQVKAKESSAELSKRYKACLDSVRVRQRMLQRFSRMLGENYETASDMSISFQPEKVRNLYDRLIETGHFRVEVPHFEKHGVFLIASRSLQYRHDDIQTLLTVTSMDQFADEDGTHPYVLLIRPENPPDWFGDTIQLRVREQSIDLKRGYVRLCASGSLGRLEDTRRIFLDTLDMHLDLVVEQRSNIHKVNSRLTETRKVAYKLSNTFMDSVETIRRQTKNKDCQELVQTCFVFATEFGQRSLMYLDSNRKQMNMLKLTKLALDWVSFVTDDCVASDKRTFRWAVLALEFAMVMTGGRHILALGEDEYSKLRTKVSGCMAVLISHFDVMGARSMLAAKAEKERSIETLMGQIKKVDQNRLQNDKEAANITLEHRLAALEEVDDVRRQTDAARSATGRVLETTNEVDRSLAYLSASATYVTMRWQQGSFIGGGTFGNVYAAMNLDSGQLMAVKEIRLQDPKLIPAIAGQIKDEMGVLEMLDHPNVVSYFGIEVHRDRVYIFMEYCQNGSLANLLEHGRIEDEQVIMVYALQLLEGLAYLHESGIVHRDIKPENILLDHNGIIKYVDFGAAKVIARQGRTLVNDLKSTKPNKSMTGTPMYMSPEVIKGENPGRGGAGDIWSLGCVILEMATGRRPWANLDNEWAIMYNIAQGNPPQLPSTDQLSPEGIDF
ncbi:unnamed protein product [Parascedosporium putredinis]|uniref:mitogen-activated protein kinase n=1 Tax=Parascedosporium putredinis TaxID=1442378 RepID=A0A9P1H0K4_9PEZI|nr:unnamed protein product [Parascedosporium putredinis]CAI7992798.1 unnamed protein product [Parascedosporium putredinis]